MEIVGLQARPLLFSTYATGLFVGVWIYTESFSNTTFWVEDWLICLLYGGTQNSCAYIPQQYNPSLGSIFVTYVRLEFSEYFEGLLRSTSFLRIVLLGHCWSGGLHPLLLQERRLRVFHGENHEEGALRPKSLI